MSEIEKSDKLDAKMLATKMVEELYRNVTVGKEAKAESRDKSAESLTKLHSLQSIFHSGGVRHVAFEVDMDKLSGEMLYRGNPVMSFNSAENGSLSYPVKVGSNLAVDGVLERRYIDETNNPDKAKHYGRMVQDLKADAAQIVLHPVCVMDKEFMMNAVKIVKLMQEYEKRGLFTLRVEEFREEENTVIYTRTKKGTLHRPDVSKTEMYGYAIPESMKPK